MKILLPVILAALFTSGVLAQSDSTKSPPASSEPSPPDTTTPPPSPPTTTTPPPSPPTTTTPEPPTTTTSTTSEPTTTSSSTTTESPTTVVTTTETPATPSPTPPSLSDGSWNITQNNVTCMRIAMKALFTVSIEGKKEYIALTQNATADGSECHFTNDTQKLVLAEPGSYTLTMIFAKEAGKVYVNSTTFSYHLDDRTGTEETDKKLFIVKSGNSYKCKAAEDVSLGNVTMEISNVHVQAFGEEGNTGFGAVEECEADDKVSDAVPIAVGCALAALIIIVLIAYLVGRRQSRQKGYQSV